MAPGAFPWPLLRQSNDDHGEIGKCLEGASSNFTEQDVTCKDAGEAGGRSGGYQIAIRKLLPTAVCRRIAGNGKPSQDGYEVDIHVGVTQPHGIDR